MGRKRSNQRGPSQGRPKFDERPSRPAVLPLKGLRTGREGHAGCPVDRYRSAKAGRRAQSSEKSVGSKLLRCSYFDMILENGYSVFFSACSVRRRYEDTRDRTR